MAPPDTEPSTPLAGVSPDLLRRAVEIYLGIAYPSGPSPEAVRLRLAWPADVPVADLVARPPFERAGKDGDKPIFALRLGNARYPHMKLQVQPWAGQAGFLLSVNTHDHALSLDPDDPGAAAFLALQAENQALKVAIEKAWDEAGLPTFPRYLRDYLLAQQGQPGQDGTTARPSMT